MWEEVKEWTGWGRPRGGQMPTGGRPRDSVRNVFEHIKKLTLGGLVRRFEITAQDHEGGPMGCRCSRWKGGNKKVR